ncbi:MAG: WD40 repeat domain-containing protein [Planctomycetales bacterium]
MTQPLDPTKARPAWDVEWQAGWVTACTFLGAPTRLAAGNQDGLILVWDLPQETPASAAPDQPLAKGEAPQPLLPVRLLKGHTNVVSALALAADARWLISTSYDHSVRIWDWNASTSGTEKVKLFAKRNRTDSEPEPVEVPVLAESLVLEGHTEWIRALSLNADRTRLLTADDCGLVILWSLPDGKELRRLQLPAGAQDIARSPDAALMAASEFNGFVPSRDDPARNHSLVRIRDLSSGEVTHDLSPEIPARKGAAQAQKSRGLAFSPDGKTLAVGRSGWIVEFGAIALFDAGTGKKLREMKGHEQGVSRLGFTPDGKFIVSAGNDTTIKFWDPEDGAEVATLGTPRGGQTKDQIFACDVAPDNSRVCGADMAGLVRVWQLG